MKNEISHAFYLTAFVLLPGLLQAQDATAPQPPYRPTPAHMWEFGLHAGTAMSFGDMEFSPNIGGGFHIRRAIDYVFSVRGDAMYGKLRQEDNLNGTSETTFQSGSLEMLVSINNLIWNNVVRRKANVYTFIGGGVTRFEVAVIKKLISDLKPVDATVQTHLDGGLGVAFRLSSRFNLGLEAKAIALFGKDADLLDGVNRRSKDVLGYGSLRLNFNLGNSNKKSEPLYWVNPMETIMNDITELKNRPAFDLTDSDADGVIDLLDQDNTTPPGVVVDTRGLPLDSDGDGIPNFQDDDPYYPQEKGLAADTPSNGTQPTNGTQPANGTPPNSRPNVSNRPIRNEEDVRKVVQDEMERIANGSSPSSANPNINSGRNPSSTSKEGSLNGKSGNSNSGNSNTNGRMPSYNGGAITDWFLPIVHFNIDSYKLRYIDYGNLASVAHVMKTNPDLMVVVTGFTDKTASEEYNLALSYQRAKAVIDHLVNIHGIPRSRLLLQYNGEDLPLVPSAGSTVMNRRVEFRLANGDDQEMEPPVPLSKKEMRRDGF